MIVKAISGAVLAGLLMAAAAPATYAGDTPSTKSDCAKHKDMKWDDATSKCVKK